MSASISNISSSTAPSILPELDHFRKLPPDLLLEIFSYLNLKECFQVKKVCRSWTAIVNDPITIYGHYLPEVNSVKNFTRFSPRFSAWESMPRHWGLYTKENVLRFSSIDQDIVTFHPPFCEQSSKFFSFTLQLPQFSDRSIYLGHSGNTYFLTPQGQTPLQLDLPTDLQPLASHKLLVVNKSDPTKNREFSLLKNLPPTPDNLSLCQIKKCFPISETKIAILTTDSTLSFWDISAEEPNCYKEIQIEPTRQVYQLGNHLLVGHAIADLRNPVFTEHGFVFENLPFKRDDIITFGSTFCAYDENTKEIRYFAVNGEGILENKWIINLSKLLEGLDKSHGSILSSCVNDINEEFILLSCKQSRAINLLILNTKGELVHHITEKLTKIELQDDSLYMYPIFAHLSGNILTYKDPQSHSIYFWHLPIKKCIQKFEWKKASYDLGETLIQDVRLSGEKLNILLSSQHTPYSNKPGKYRLIQFDPQYIKRPGIWGMIDNICSTVKTLYYAFPRKNTF